MFYLDILHSNLLFITNEIVKILCYEDIKHNFFFMQCQTLYMPDYNFLVDDAVGYHTLVSKITG